MQDANRFDAVNPDLPSESGAESEEILLADLTGTDEADLFFEGLIDRDTGMGRTLERLRTPGIAGSDVTGGDLDDDWYQAEVVGEEAVGGQNPTPDQSVTELLLRSVGIVTRDGETIHTRDTLTGRDRRRWELNPSSSEDYQERREPE